MDRWDGTEWKVGQNYMDWNSGRDGMGGCDAVKSCAHDALLSRLKSGRHIGQNLLNKRTATCIRQ